MFNEGWIEKVNDTPTFELEVSNSYILANNSKARINPARDTEKP